MLSTKGDLSCGVKVPGGVVQGEDVADQMGDSDQRRHASDAAEREDVRLSPQRSQALGCLQRVREGSSSQGSGVYTVQCLLLCLRSTQLVVM